MSPAIELFAMFSAFYLFTHTVHIFAMNRKNFAVLWDFARNYKKARYIGLMNRGVYPDARFILQTADRVIDVRLSIFLDIDKTWSNSLWIAEYSNTNARRIHAPFWDESMIGYKKSSNIDKGFYLISVFYIIIDRICKHLLVEYSNHATDDNSSITVDFIEDELEKEYASFTRRSKISGILC